MSYSGVQPQYGTFPSDLFTGNGSNTVFTMSSVPGNDAALLVTVDGVRQHTDTYSYTANTLTFSEAPGSGAIIETVNMGSRADIIITEGVYKKTQFTATAAQTNFTIATGYTVGFVDVYLNGIRLVVADDFTATDGSTIILATPAASGDAVEVVAYGTFNVANALLKSGDTMSGNLVVSGTTTMLSPVAIANTTGNTFVVANTGAVTITGTLTASANINFDSGTFFVDGTNNRVGINSTSPLAPLSLYNASSGLLATLQNATTGTTSGDGSYIALDGNNLQISNKESANVIFYTADTERMRIDASGRVTTPYQPAFEAYRANLTLPTQTWTTIVYDNCTINRGSHYNTSNGRFTAPVAGFYFFEAIGEGGGGAFHTIIAVNGGVGSVGDTAQNWTSSNVSKQSFVLNLNAGDYVYVQHYIDSGRTMTSNRCHFHGFFLG